MAKTRDFRPSLRHFVKVLNSFRGRWYDYDIFSDFVDYMAGGLLWHGDKELAHRLQDKYGKDYPRFAELSEALVQTMADQIIGPTDWFDALGELYEEISSRSKASALGQFFTPPSLCDAITQMQLPSGKPVFGKTVNDPACGSGRTLLSFHAHCPGNFMVGQDLDPICFKMSAINMAMHGCRGVVMRGDTLRYKFDRAFLVNPLQYAVGPIPHLIPTSPYQAFRRIDAWKAIYGKDDAPDPMKEPEGDIIVGKRNQIELFAPPSTAETRSAIS